MTSVTQMPKVLHMATEISELLPTADVAARLGKDVSTVLRMVKAGRLTPVVKTPGLRGAYLFDPEDVAALLEPESQAS